MSIILLLLYLVSFLIIWQFVGYPVMMVLVSKVIKTQPKDYTFQPYVSIIVPTFNEETCIERRIKNLSTLDYPKDKYEILVVDSGSEDATASIVENLLIYPEPSMPSMRILRESGRNGKASAINYAKRYAAGEIILIADANSCYDKKALKELAVHFADPEVGAVSGRYTIMNTNSELPKSESFYWELENIMFTGESKLDSISTVIGTISAWRKELLCMSTGSISEDLDMTIRVRKAGYKIKYEPCAIAYEPAATLAKDQIKQRQRTSLGTIQCIFKHLGYFLFPGNLYALLIIPSHKALQMLSPLLILSVPVLYLLEWNLEASLVHAIVTALAFGIMFLLLMLLKTGHAGKKTIGRQPFSVLKTACYVLLNEYIILTAWANFITRKRSVLWEKAESTRTYIPEYA